MDGHHILKCKECNKVIEQCRCMKENKPIIYSVCDQCLKIKEDEKPKPYITS